MKVKKVLMLALLAGFVASLLAVTGEAAVQKKKKRKRVTPEQRFAKMDTNNDKILSKDEFIAAQKGKRAKNAERRWKRMVKFAKNPEKGLTLEEYKKATARKKRKKKGNA
jgi:hypothetical protein